MGKKLAEEAVKEGVDLVGVIGGLDASAYAEVADLDQVLDTLTVTINEQAAIFATP